MSDSFSAPLLIKYYFPVETLFPHSDLIYSFSFPYFLLYKPSARIGQ